MTDDDRRELLSALDEMGKSLSSIDTAITAARREIDKAWEAINRITRRAQQ